MIYVEQTSNRKLGSISATHLGQVTCPNDCVFRNSGCYAETGPQGFTTRRLAKSKISALQSANDEIESLRNRKVKTPIRLHVVGDFISQPHLGLATYHLKCVTAWSYTHNWRNLVPTTLSVLASVENLDDLALAKSKGWACAIVVNEFKSHSKYSVGGHDVIPCPQQTGRAQTCKDCLLCTKADYLKSKNLSIAFAVHGQNVQKVRGSLIS